MYVVAFMYPSKTDTSFDYDHFVNVHLPLGIGLTKKHLDIVPEKIIVYSPIRGGDGEINSAPYCAISSVFFSEQADAKTFCTLFEYEEAARRLSEDFANYTPAAPEVIMTEVHELTNMDGMLETFATHERATM